MALKPEDLERLRLSIEDLTRADRELFEATQRSQGIGDFGPQRLTASQQAQLGGAAVTSVAGGPQTPYWQQEAKSESAGHALSAAKTMLSAGGFGMAGSLVGGLAHGPMGLVEAAAGIGGQFLQGQRQVTQSGIDAFINAPPTDTDKMIKTRVGHAVRTAQRDRQNKLEEEFGFAMGSDEDMANARFGRMVEQREDDLNTRHGTLPQEVAEQRVRQRLEKFAEAGGLETPNGRAVADQMYQQEVQWATRAITGLDNWARRRDERTSGAPGSQGRLGPK